MDLQVEEEKMGLRQGVREVVGMAWELRGAEETMQLTSRVENGEEERDCQTRGIEVVEEDEGGID